MNSGGATNALSHFELIFEKALWLITKAEYRLVCPLILGDVCGENTDKPVKNNVGTKISKNASF